MTMFQVYCGVSLDGYIAGVNDDLGWLENPDPAKQNDPGIVSFSDFMQQTGSMLMGRRTFDVVTGFGGPWPYGETPILVATSRPVSSAPASVSTASGDIRELCREAARLAAGRNVYVDGGAVISQALDAGCIDEMILTVVPVLLGKGIPLYAGERRHRFESRYLGDLGGTMQFRLTP
ncbi:MAG: dihydrofolate reductase [Gemmatimonadetes bacterium]|nr:dihydrofolate reductase [Gemmatimonadota bacterium]